MMGLKQESLAEKLGGDWTQRKLSYLETREVIEPELINELAEALKVAPEAILNFDEERAMYNIQNNYQGSSTVNNQSPFGGINTFNPRDKYDQLGEENKKLYEALLNAEIEKK